MAMGLLAAAKPVAATAGGPEPCDTWYYGSAPGNHRVAQTFTVAPGEDEVTGFLIYIDGSVGTSGDYIVQLLATDGSGVPTNTVLRSAIGTAGLVETYFEPPLAVAPGQVYALALTRPSSSEFGYLFKFLECRDGAMFHSDSQGGPWYVESDGYDLFAFPVYHRPPPDPGPGDPPPPDSDDDDGEGSAKCEKAKRKVERAKERVAEADTAKEKEEARDKLKRAKKKKKKACGPG